MCLNTYDDHNPIHPANRDEDGNDIEIDFEDKYKEQIKTTLYHIGNLKKLAEFEDSIRTFGFLTFDEQTEKNNILENY